MILNEVEGLNLLVDANISDILLFSIHLKDLGLVILFNFCDLNVFPQKACWEIPRGVHCVWECIHSKRVKREKLHGSEHTDCLHVYSTKLQLIQLTPLEKKSFVHRLYKHHNFLGNSFDVAYLLIKLQVLK